MTVVRPRRMSDGATHWRNDRLQSTRSWLRAGEPIGLGRIPRLVAPGGRLGRRLSLDAARQAGARQHRARRHRRADRAVAARDGRADGRRSSPISKRPSLPGMTHWQHPRFFAYFPGNAAPGLRRRRISGLGDGGAMHALADLAGGDRARDENDRLAAPGARPAGRLLRRDPGFGLVGDAGRRADHARASARLGRQHRRASPGRRRCASTARPGAYVDRPGDLGVRHRRGQSRQAARHGPAARHRRRPNSRPRSSATRPPACLPAGIIACVGGTSVGGTDDVAARRARSPGGTGSICMSTPPGPARR